MVYVKFESQQPKSLSQLVEELRKVQELERVAIATLSDAIDAYSQQNPAQDYWEGFLSQVLSLFPEELVKKLAGETDTRETEDLRENVQNLERELATKTQNLRMVEEERDELREELTEWELKANQLANNLIESSAEDRIDYEAEIRRLNTEIESLKKSLDQTVDAGTDLLEKRKKTHEEEKKLIVKGFEERVQFFSAEIERYRKLEEEWGVRLAQQAERIQDLEKGLQIVQVLDENQKTPEPADIIHERVEQKVKQAADNYTEWVEIASNVGYLKVKESGELLAAYVGVKKTPHKKMKAMTAKWAEYIAGLYGCKAEGREALRMKNKGFDWEIKITGIQFNCIKGLSALEVDRYPYKNEGPNFELKKAQPFDHLCPEYHVMVNGEEYGRVWRIPGKLPHAWKHNLFGPNDTPFNSPEGAAKALVEIEREADKETEDDSDTPEF